MNTRSKAGHVEPSSSCPAILYGGSGQLRIHVGPNRARGMGAAPFKHGLTCGLGAARADPGRQSQIAMEVELKFEISLTEEDASVARRMLYQLVRDEDPAAKFAELGLHALAFAISDARQARGKYFPGELFADPAWDILLGLYCAQNRGERMTVTAVGQSFGLAQATSFRWLNELEKAGLVERVRDPGHRRRVFATLTALACEKVTLWLEETRARLRSE